MTNTREKQQGASAIVILITLAVIGIGIFLGLQYIPQRIEAGTMDKLLSTIESEHAESPFRSKHDIESRIANQLNINEMNEMMGNFKVTEDGQRFVIKVNYDRELNLIYEKKIMPYEKTIVLE